MITTASELAVLAWVGILVVLMATGRPIAFGVWAVAGVIAAALHSKQTWRK